MISISLRRLGTGILCSLALLLASQLAASELGPVARPEGPAPVVFEPSHFVAMRDGVRLSTDIYRPSAEGERYPVVLMRTPYNKQGDGPAADARMFASHGYAVAVQDVRGKWESEGVYEFYSHDLTDFEDTISWLVKQPWAAPRVGTYGCSYLGEVQIIQATTRNPYLKAMIPQASAGGTGTAGGRYRFFSGVTGGAYELHQGLGWFPRAGIKYHPVAPRGLTREQYLEMRKSFDLRPSYVDIDYGAAQWMLPLDSIMRRIGAPANDFDLYVSTPLGSEAWDRKGFLSDDDQVDVPALFVNSWYDYGVGDTLHQFDFFRRKSVSRSAREGQRLIIGPGTHCSSEEGLEQTFVGARDAGNARRDLWRLYLGYFDHWLKGDRRALDGVPRVLYYLLGKNEWRASNEWPLEATVPTPFFLSSGGSANTLHGDGVLSLDPEPGRGASFDRYTYDPENPVPSLGGPLCCTASEEALPGSYDQREVEERDDVLVYTTEPLGEGLTVVGPLEVVLYVSSSAPDTDFTAKLVDVYPDGRAFNVQEGILRARYRKGFDQTHRMERGRVYELRIDMQATGNFFGPGHRIRLEVSSSNFPRFDRNLNTGGRNFDESEPIVAQNRVHHSAAHPSRLILPVVAPRD